MNTKPYIAFIALLIFALPLAPLQAATFLPGSDEVTSLRSETKGDVYGASRSIVIPAAVDGDIFVAGENIDISGSVADSVFAAGQILSITGDVKDDVRVAGNTISIGSNIAHDLFAAGSSIVLAQDSHVRGDAYVAGETITISGTIDGSVRAAATKVTFASSAVVLGDITVYGNSPVIQEGAKVSGKVTTIAPDETNKRVQEAFSITGFITSLLCAAVLALLLLFAAPALVGKAKEFITKSPAQSGVTGLIWLMLCIPVTLLLLISGIGAYVGLLVLALTFPAMLLAFGLMVSATGSMAYRLVAKKDGTIWYDALIGALIVSLVAFLGPLGFILLSVAFLIALGAILKALWSMIQGK